MLTTQPCSLQMSQGSIKSLDVLVEWCRNWKVKVNMSKSGIMYLRQKRVARTNVQYIDHVVWVRDLGVQSGSGEDRAGSDERPEVVLWRWNSSPKSFTFSGDGGPTGQVAGEDAMCDILG